jgi:hypothetical protein
MVLWHELGHLVFNPDCSIQSMNPGLLKPAGKYKASKALYFLIEGAAEWFAFHAEEWDDEYRRRLFNLDEDDRVDEYSYVTTLLHFHPVMLQRVFLPLVFGCWQSALRNLPVDDGKNPVLKLKPEDFSVPEQGADFGTIDGFVSRVSGPLGVRLGIGDILFLMTDFPEFFDQKILDDGLLAGLELPSTQERKSQEDIAIHIPFFKADKVHSGWSFDPFMLPMDGAGNEGALVVGFSMTPFETSVFAMDKSAKSGDNPWYVCYSADSRGTGKINVWCRSPAWAEPVARRAAFMTCLDD